MFDEVAKKLMKDLNIENIHAVPGITKVVVNVGVGKNKDKASHTEAVVRDLASITGQKPIERRARKSVAGFNVRENDLVGYSVTLRGKRMKDFTSRFVNVTLPRVRDFRGLPMSGLDKDGNLNVGLREHLPFPEIHPDRTDVIFGIQITFVTSTNDQKIGETLFRDLGFPLIKEGDESA